MKLLFLICTLTGLGWLGIAMPPDATQASAPRAAGGELVRCAPDCDPGDCDPGDCGPGDCDPGDCAVDITCTPWGSCLVTCTASSGRTFSVELECAADCAGPEDCEPADCLPVCLPAGCAGDA